MTEKRSQSALPPDSHTDVTASEVANYAYCAKAWHLRYVLRREPSGQASVHQQAGVVAHEIHGVRVKRLAWLERRALILVVGLCLLGAALVVLALLWSNVGRVAR
jgi:hypothetical protein